MKLLISFWKQHAHHRLVVGLVLFGLILALPAGRLLAQQETQAPDAPGSISGRLTDGDGEPLVGIRVSLYRDGKRIRNVASEADGAYHIPTLGAGIYHLGFFDTAWQYAFEYYDDVAKLPQATDVVVAGQDVHGIDAQLTVGGRITGTVLIAPDFSLSFAYLTVYQQIGETWLSLHTTGVTSTDATYEFGGLATGQYAICVSGSLRPYQNIAECYDNAALPSYSESPAAIPSRANATPISVTSGEVTGDIDFLLGDQANLANVRGTVRSESGVPLSDIMVEAIFEIPCNCPDDTSFYTFPETVARTDENGDYQVWLYPRATALRFDDLEQAYVPQYYADAIRLSQATWLMLEPYDDIAGIDVTLQPASIITGTVLVGGVTAPSSGSVTAKPYPTGAWAGYEQDPFQYVDAYFSSSIDSKTGEYSLQRLPAGSYQITASARLDGIRHTGAYQQPDADGPALVAVDVGETRTDINIELGQTFFNGVMTGTITAEGAPAPGVRVELLDYRETFYADGPMSVIVYALTDEKGEFRLEGLADGRYSLFARDPSFKYASVCTNNEEGLPAPCEVFDVASDAGSAGAALDLVRAGEISGRVIAPVEDPSSITVFAFHHFLVGLPSPVSMYATEVQAEKDGTYRLRGLLPGTYRVGAYYADGAKRVETFFPRANAMDRAETISVAAEETTTDIDLVFPLSNRNYLPLVGR